MDVVAPSDPTAREKEQAGLVAMSRDGLLLTDRDGKIRFANPAAARILNEEALAERALASYVSAAHRRQFRAILRRAAADEEVGFETELAPRGGPPVHVGVCVRPLGEDLGWALREGQPPHAEDARGIPLESSQLGQVLGAVRDGVVVTDRSRRVVYANGAARAMFAPHDVRVGEPVPDPWAISTRQLVDDLFEHDAFNAEAVVEPDGATAYWVRAYQSDAGETAVLLLSDVTADERREQAERDFVAHAAHELQSPLTGISGAVEVLLAGAHEQEEPRLRFLEHIARENDRLTRLLRSLLVLAQSQATDTPVRTGRVELRPLLDHVAAHASAGTPVDVDCEDAIGVVAHRELVQHALSNLVLNAVVHGGGDGLVLRARNGDGVVRVDVVDSGPGMSREQRERAFDRFYRGGARTAEGFGLGLSIARQAVRAVGGELELSSNPRGGTIATLTLRLA